MGVISIPRYGSRRNARLKTRLTRGVDRVRYHDELLPPSVFPSGFPPPLHSAIRLRDRVEIISSYRDLAFTCGNAQAALDRVFSLFLDFQRPAATTAATTRRRRDLSQRRRSDCPAESRLGSPIESLIRLSNYNLVENVRLLRNETPDRGDASPF